MQTQFDRITEGPTGTIPTGVKVPRTELKYHSTKLITKYVNLQDISLSQPSKAHLNSYQRFDNRHLCDMQGMHPVASQDCLPQKAFFYKDYKNIFNKMAIERFYIIMRRANNMKMIKHSDQ